MLCHERVHVSANGSPRMPNGLYRRTFACSRHFCQARTTLSAAGKALSKHQEQHLFGFCFRMQSSVLSHRCAAQQKPTFARRQVKAQAIAAQSVPSKPQQNTMQHGRVFNFSAGPAILPLEVLEQAQRDCLNFNGSGMSVMEMSHRSKAFDGIIKAAESDLRQLLSIPDNYKVLFVQGGASTQFAAIPLNFTHEGDTVDYIVTGAWSKKAYEEASKFGLNVNLVAKGDNKSVPAKDSWKLSPDAKYVHYCDNETIGGVEFQSPPETGDVPLIADMSSNFLSKPVDVSKYGMIYAGAQKNVGPSGVVIAIVREDLLGKARPSCPTMLNYSIAAENGSMYNTPPCWPIYICGLVFKHLLKLGGLAGAQERNAVKAGLLYDTISDSNGFYFSPVEESVRSKMNVPFTIPSNADLEKAFIAEATAAQLLELKGHRSVGGMRASIYNAMPLEGVQALTTFMKEFHAKNSK